MAAPQNDISDDNMNTLSFRISQLPELFKMSIDDFMNGLSLNIASLSAEVHVYCRDISSILPKNIDLLDETERRRAAKFKFAHHRERFIAAHTALREILISYLAENPVILIAPQGKPYLKDHPEIQFNLSHSENIVLCAVTQDMPVGIDVEYNLKSHDFMGIAERFFSPDEVEQLKLSENSRLLFLKLWTRKEAWLKLNGLGIGDGLHQKIPEDYFIQDFNPAVDYTAALVMPQTSKQLIFFGIGFE